MPKKVAYLFILIFFLLFRPPVFADTTVVINEFVSDVDKGEEEWVEFYNPGSSGQSLSGWVLEERTGSDLSGVTSHSLDSVTVPANDFAIYEFSSSKLNNSGDILTLKNGSIDIDEIAYGSAPNSQVEAPDKNQSAGRKTDGSGNWVIFGSSTKSSTNNAGQVLPDPSPTPTSQTLSSQSTSSKKSPSPTPKTVSTTTVKSPSPTSTKASPQILSASDESSLLLASSSSDTSPTPSPEATQSSFPKTKVAALLTGSGAILIGLSFCVYLWYKRFKEKDDGGINDAG